MFHLSRKFFCQPASSTAAAAAATSAAAAAAAAGAPKPKPKRKLSTHTPPKISSNTSDAYGTGGDEVPSYSSLRHTGYLLFHGRRMGLAALMGMGYLALGPTFAAAGSAAAVQKGLYLTTAAVLQRFSIHGASNHVKKDLTGHVCVVTGGTSGIGLYTAMQLLNCGATVVLPCKPGREEDTLGFLEANVRVDEGSTAAPVKERVTFVAMDYNDQLSIVAAAARIKGLYQDRIDLLVNCAAIWREEPALTKQHFEQHIGVNFLGPFHFTEAMLPSLRKSPHKCGRIVYVTCAGHNGVSRPNVVQERMLLRPTDTDPQVTARCYSASKLGNIYHAQSLAERRYEGIPLNRPSELHPVEVCCADPGFSNTNLQREVQPLLGHGLAARALRSFWAKNAYEGSQTVVNCCLRDDIENGGYYAECRLMPSGLSRRAQDTNSRDEVVRWAMAKTIAKYYTTKVEK